MSRSHLFDECVAVLCCTSSLIQSSTHTLSLSSFMVLASNGVGLAIDIWKISKAISFKFEGGKIEWVEAQSYKKSRTKEYDEIATSHLLFVTMPLVAG